MEECSLDLSFYLEQPDHWFSGAGEAVFPIEETRFSLTK